jgi:site-specific recombinase XerD
LLTQLEEHLRGKGFKPDTVETHLRHCRRFLAYLKQKRISVDTAEPFDVACYVRRELMRYRRRYQSLPPKLGLWRNTRSVPVCGLLRMVRGHWPPASEDERHLLRLEEKLKAGGYRQSTISHSVCEARSFLSYLKDRKVPIQAVQPSHLSAFLRMRLALYRRQRSSEPKHLARWKAEVARPPRVLLRLVQEIWPPIETPKDAQEAFRQATCHEYGRWLADVRGLAQCTVESQRATAKEFLDWLGARATTEDLLGLTLNEVDAYLAYRAPGLGRRALQWIAYSLRSFLRHLYAQGLIARDLAPSVKRPRIYENENIPSAVSERDIRAVLVATHRDRSPVGLRDYAILMLLSKYGLRAGEIAKLRLDDIDWRRRQLRVRHWKTGAESMLPLLPSVGEAILDYLQHGRPHTDLRQVFLAKNAPLRAFVRGSAISTMVRSRFKRADIHPAGKRGPHAFRHARAVGLLRMGTSLKTIADILGHRSMQSTGVYLKLATSDLRAIALEVPSEVRP